MDYFPETRVKQFPKQSQFDGERGMALVPSAPWVQSFDEFPAKLWLTRIKLPLQPAGETAFIQTFIPPTPPLAFDTYDVTLRPRRSVKGFEEFVTYTVAVQAPVDFWEAGRRRRARAEGFSEFSLVSSFPNPVEQFESKLLRRKQRSDGFVSDAQFVTQPVTVSPDEFSGVLRRLRPLLVAARDVPTVLIPPPPPPIVGGLDLSSTLRRKYTSVVMSPAVFDVYQYFVFVQIWSNDGLAYLLKLEDK